MKKKLIIHKTKLEDFEEEQIIITYDNMEPIEIGDKFLFYFGGIADVQECCSETEKYEINKNDKQYNDDVIDFVYNFWRNCYKIKRAKKINLN